jgi:hypothetical protein
MAGSVVTLITSVNASAFGNPREPVHARKQGRLLEYFANIHKPEAEKRYKYGHHDITTKTGEMIQHRPRVNDNAELTWDSIVFCNLYTVCKQDKQAHRENGGKNAPVGTPSQQPL